MKNYVTSVFFGVRNHLSFCEGIQRSLNELPGTGIFAGDNLFTFSRNLSFLDDDAFMDAFRKSARTDIEQAVIWRTYVLAWAARRGVNIDGDFVECGCYKGVSARILADYLDLQATGKAFYLYDLFEHSSDMDHGAMPEHGAGLYEQVVARFVDLPNVHVTKGSVPEVLVEKSPEKIAFLHVDMNSATAELGALETLFDRVSPGASIVLDDYGWAFYRDQKVREDAFFAARGYQVLELPTGQGLVIK
ncbi:class I SAM-dependent methyltransferase [Rhodospirillaceae bacterium SYSU D60014]|uniref:class I SAM-dependent methyltransferase n=1 Tax=Virgifigura deserti TaxID=2268457 RepID=UPI000E660B23